MFRTELTIAPATGQLPRTARVLTLGSCFADSIGSRLVANKVEALVNPFGTVFQPLALAKLLRAAAGEEVDWQQHLVEARGRWQSYDLHGSIGADSPVDLLLHIQELVRQTGEFLRQADVLLLTLGTAWAYRLRETGELVSNCHKQPADLFVRELLTPDEIINALAETHAYLRRINPELRFVLTVSPVRHLKDTLQLNSVSKSVLRLATHIVSDLLPGVAYFPAYELLVDDLRDYRFYAADMLHPSEVAEDYVWEKFARAYFDADFGRFRKEWAGVRQSLGHRPLHPGAPEHRLFLESTLVKLEQLSLRNVDVTAELAEVRTHLAALPAPRQPEPVAEVEDDEERIDIGDGTSVAATATPAADAVPAPSGEQRLPRLSPEEFRAQRGNRSDHPERGRRDGRGKGQPVATSENEQFQSPVAFSDVRAIEPEVVDFTTEDLALSGAGADAAAVEGGALPEGQKKKKRRSRGGAKRTARKHALRLAAEGLDAEDNSAENVVADEQASTTTPVGTTAEAETNTPADATTTETSSRRDRGGRVPRVPLFAAPAPAEPQPLIADADYASAPELSDAATETEKPLATGASPAGKSRNGRNRNRRKEDAMASSAMAAVEGVSEQNSDVAQEAAAVAATPDSTPTISTDGETTNPQQFPVAALPVAATSATATAPSGVPAPQGNKRSNRAKRVVSGARAEKPAVDTPIIPVPATATVRTQVAAGRLTGSSATLVEPTAPAKPAGPKKAASTKATAKPTAPTAAITSPAVEAETNTSATPKASAPKAAKTKTAKKPATTPDTALPVADSPVAPTPVAAEATAAKATAKPKAAAAKAAAAKPAAKKAVATKKPVAKAAAEVAPTPPAEPAPKAPAAKPKAAKPKPAAPATEAAAKPKSPRKPAKPA